MHASIYLYLYLSIHVLSLLWRPGTRGTHRWTHLCGAGMSESFVGVSPVWVAPVLVGRFLRTACGFAEYVRVVSGHVSCGTFE